MAIIRHSKLQAKKQEVIQEPKVISRATKEVKELFTKEEATFLISKLRQATYQGTEFETFYQIMAKLTKIAEKQ